MIPSRFSPRPNLATNRKVIGATKCELDGIQFDSKIEKYFYSRAKMFGIWNQFKMKPRFLLQPGFMYFGKKIQDIEIIPDFIHIATGEIVDTKGWQTPDNKIKIKMLKYLNRDKMVTLISTQREVDRYLLKFLKR